MQDAVCSVLEKETHLFPQYSKLMHVIDSGFDDPSMPNVLLYGCSKGFPHHILWEAVVRTRFGQFHRNSCTWKKSWTYQETPYFFEIDLSHPSQPKDIGGLTGLLKEIVANRCIHAHKHIFYLKNIDAADGKGGYTMLRVLLERYSNNAWFVCSTYCFGSIESPVRSRFFSLRVPAMSVKDIETLFSHMNKELPAVVVKHKLCNVSLALFVADMSRYEARLPFPVDALCKLNAPFMFDIQKNKACAIEKIRLLTQQLSTHGYKIADIAADLLEVGVVSAASRHSFLELAAHIDHMCAKTDKYRQSLFIEWLLVSAFFPN